MLFFVEQTMNNWDTHEVHFQPSEGLTSNETSVRVLDHDGDIDSKIAGAEERKEMLEEVVDDDNVVEHVLRRQQLTERVKTDPGYKFLMMVAAFSSRRIGKIINLPRRTAGLYPDPEHISATACEKEANDDHQWIQQPEVSGLVQLSASVYGHIKEAEMIANNGFVCASLKTLIEDPNYAQLFARLVACRMSISSCLSASRQMLDATFRRLHQEQNMVLKALRCRPSQSSQGHDWTRPVHAQIRC